MTGFKGNVLISANISLLKYTSLSQASPSFPFLSIHDCSVYTATVWCCHGGRSSCSFTSDCLPLLGLKQRMKKGWQADRAFIRESRDCRNWPLSVGTCLRVSANPCEDDMWQKEKLKNEVLDTPDQINIGSVMKLNDTGTFIAVCPRIRHDFILSYPQRVAWGHDELFIFNSLNPIGWQFRLKYVTQ